MRAFVFILVLANLFFFAWAKGLIGGSASPDAARLVQEIAPERLQIVGNGKPPPAPAAAAGCVVYPALTAGERAILATTLADAAFADLRQETRQTARPEGGSHAWWVFIAPQADAPAAEKKAAELRALGVKDYFIVSEGSARHAISLGIFSSQAAAQAHLEALRAKGVRSAEAAERADGKEPPAAVELAGPADLVQQATATLRDHLPNASHADCGAR